MPNNSYQTVPLYDYIKLLENEEATQKKNNTEAIKSSINNYLLHHRRAQSNAKLLESLLDD